MKLKVKVTGAPSPGALTVAHTEKGIVGETFNVVIPINVDEVPKVGDEIEVTVHSHDEVAGGKLVRFATYSPVKAPVSTAKAK